MKLQKIADGLRRNWDDRYWYADVFNRYVPRYYYQEVKSNDGAHVVERDWDNLFILDGCRFDLFEEVYRGSYRGDLGGTLERVTSRGSASTEFLEENFHGRELKDTVYVTANPFVYQIPGDPFHHVDHVWMDDWDDELETVRPETMVEHAKEAHERFPDKRLIVHFMQPHYPFVGEYRLDGDRGYLGAVAKSLDEDVPDVKLVWERLREGDVDEADVWRAYRDNLALALDNVRELVEDVPGKHVVTADHGNALGERSGPFPTRVYGHDDYLHIPALVDVPWLELPADERRDITRGDRETEGREYEDESVERRLEALGYR
ncbi:MULTISPECIES: hypothetical protein [unclassified Haloferax]|uniref:hypothetical protein n=1 Tax=unclassified Haloferax TaxID=2625095 RepID=UPI00287697AF|nr:MULTISPECIES: hypothetical protein [unclassified Haloferax]MDS0241005.1 hypothetical protein [Haloferax sp. S2CR25]MDS0444126.1 hypothetical protein [Haloferax sp. S2CR25-2]